jgi:hypothetical protein
MFEYTAREKVQYMYGTRFPEKGREQGDQIGRIFANFCSFVKNYINCPNLCNTYL